MDDLLYKLYIGDYDSTPERDKKQQELDHKIYAEWEKAERMFGKKFMERLFDLEGEREEIREFLYFREGFRLGIRLMLEGLTPA